MDCDTVCVCVCVYVMMRTYECTLYVGRRWTTTLPAGSNIKNIIIVSIITMVDTVDGVHDGGVLLCCYLFSFITTIFIPIIIIYLFFLNLSCLRTFQLHFFILCIMDT